MAGWMSSMDFHSLFLSALSCVLCDADAKRNWLIVFSILHYSASSDFCCSYLNLFECVSPAHCWTQPGNLAPRFHLAQEGLGFIVMGCYQTAAGY